MWYQNSSLLVWDLAKFIMLYFEWDIQSNLDGSNTDGSFTMANSNSFLSPYEFFSDSSRKQIFKEILLFYREIVCCVYSLESPRWGDPIEYTQHKSLCRKSKKFP